jgi:hypothetical protein
MRILVEKLNDARHRLVIERAPGAREAMDCETRSYLLHDFLHYAVESEARLATGLWGNLAAGKTLADMNDRTGASMKDAAPDMGAIEQVVGALHGSTKGIPAAALVAGIRRFAASLGVSMPDWLTEPFVVAVQERMRRLQGQWRATPFGGAMELPWPG